ncbi:unnamed protein product, partial [Prorocentrum cordatum]
MQDVTGHAECFGPAMALLNLSAATTKDYTGELMSFTCVYVGSKSNIYFGDSTSATAVASQNYQYICIGVLTSTASSSTTRSRHAECFGPAMALLNLSSATTKDYTGEFMSFTCVYVGITSSIYFGDSTSETAVASQNYQYICIGVLTSTASSSTTRSSSATSSTTVTSTT